MSFLIIFYFPFFIRYSIFYIEYIFVLFYFAVFVALTDIKKCLL